MTEMHAVIYALTRLTSAKEFQMIILCPRVTLIDGSRTHYGDMFKIMTSIR